MILAGCLVLAAVAFALHASHLLYDGRYSVTRQDYWRIYKLDLRLPFPQNALYKHNDHPIFFGSLIWLPVLYFFNNDQTLLFFLGLGVTFATLGLLLFSLSRSHGLDLLQRTSLGCVYTIATLWVLKANITASGGFSCMNSMATAGCLLAFVFLDYWRVATATSRRVFAAFGVVSSALVASFSFGTGLAIWPALAIVVVTYRLGWQRAVWLCLVGSVSAIIFIYLPNNGRSEIGGGLTQTASELTTVGWRFVQMLGAPWAYYGRDWLLPHRIDQTACLVAGMLGLAGLLLGLYMLIARYRSNRPIDRAEIIACGMVVFILASFALVAVGRSGVMVHNPTEALAPRYCFWTPFFWAPLVVLALYTWPRLRAHPRLFAVAVLLVGVGTLPSQLAMGAAYRIGRKKTEAAALRLVCRAEDDASLTQLFNGTSPEKVIYPLLNSYIRDGSDMFSWPGAKLVQQILPPEPEPSADSPKLLGNWRVDRMVSPSRRGEPVAHFSGWCFAPKAHRPADYVLIYEENRQVVGLGRCIVDLPARNQKFDLPSRYVLGFEGYICNYSERRNYECRASVDGRLAGQPLKRNPVNPSLSLPTAGL